MNLLFRASIVLKTIIKIILDCIQSFFVLFAKVLHLIDFPVPLNSSMRKTSSRSISHYYISGIRTYLPIATCALRENIKLSENIRILDFGCGVGRQLLHFTRLYPKPAYYACDIDETSVNFIKKNYPKVNVYVNKPQPLLQYPDGFFHMIYSVSIFSHLCLEDQKKWLPELGRITMPGGICFLTTEGITSLKYLSLDFSIEENSLKEKLKRSGFLYKEYDFFKENRRMQNFLKRYAVCLGSQDSYGNTVLSPQYILKEWNTDYFDVVDIVEGIIDHRQDLVILKRK